MWWLHYAIKRCKQDRECRSKEWMLDEQGNDWSCEEYL